MGGDAWSPSLAEGAGPITIGIRTDAGMGGNADEVWADDVEAWGTGVVVVLLVATDGVWSDAAVVETDATGG